MSETYSEAFVSLRADLEKDPFEDHPHSSPPDVLYHYTGTSGLCGILDSQRFWATHYRFLNDSSEINYGMTLLRHVADDIAREYTASDAPHIETFLQQASSEANIFERGLQAYVTCFCARDDLLNQWRVYTSGGGYSIGVNTKQWRNRYLHPASSLNSEQTFLVYKMEYDEQRQRKLLHRMLMHACKTFYSHAKELSDSELVEAIDACSGFVLARAATLLMTFKHPSFEPEQEWRLIHLVSDKQQSASAVRLREGTYGLTPYVLLNVIPPGDGGKISLHSVRHGPSLNPDNAKFAMRCLLKKHGYDLEPSGSDLPIRVG